MYAVWLLWYGSEVLGVFAKASSAVAMRDRLVSEEGKLESDYRLEQRSVW